VVVARPIVTPDVSLAGKSTRPPIRVAAMRPSAADAGSAGARWAGLNRRRAGKQLREDKKSPHVRRKAAPSDDDS
jgi:hypothetical protein